VSKQVGGAVTRNRVKRRLRALAREELVAHPTGWDVVVRALPLAAVSSFEEMEKSWRSAFSKATSAWTGSGFIFCLCQGTWRSPCWSRTARSSHPSMGTSVGTIPAVRSTPWGRLNITVPCGE